MAKYIVKGQWHREQYGHVYTVKAANSNGRILAVVNVEVPIDPATDLRGRFGDDFVDEIERTANEDVKRVAQGWEKPAPQKVAS